MKNLNYLPLHFSIGLALGIGFGFYFNIAIGLQIAFVFLSFLLLLYFYRNVNQSFNPSYGFSILTFLLFVGIGCFQISIGKPENQKNHYLQIQDTVGILEIEITEVLKSNIFSNRYFGKLLRYNQQIAQGKILLSIAIDSTKQNLLVGDRLLTGSRLISIQSNLNPSTFDYKAYLEKQQVYQQLRLKQKDFKKLESSSTSLSSITNHWRNQIIQKLKQKSFSKQELAIFSAILLGQRNEVSSTQFNDYKNAGAVHILAVSGLHIGIVLMLLNFVLRPLLQLKNGKLIRLVIVVLSLWFYAVLVGLSASVVRAVTMFTAVALGMFLNRPSGVQQSLILSFFVLLFFHPWYLFDVGFQLSYTAVFSIVSLEPKFKKLWSPKHKVSTYFWNLITVSFAAQIGILPLTLYYFHQFPSLFFISSLVIIPFLGILLALGFFIIICLSLQILPKFLLTFYEKTLLVMNQFVGFIAQQEAFIFSNISISLFTVAVCYILIFNIIHFLENKNIKALFLGLFCIIALQVEGILQKKHFQKKKEMVVFHQIAKTMIAVKNGAHLTVFHDKGTFENRAIKNYETTYSIFKSRTHYPIKNSLKIFNKTVLVIDSFGVYKGLNFQPDFVVLSQSPKVNLDRLIQELHPNTIIADGSNYKSYTQLWRTSCEKNNISFYNTATQGAFVYSQKP